MRFSIISTLLLLCLCSLVTTSEPQSPFRIQFSFPNENAENTSGLDELHPCKTTHQCLKPMQCISRGTDSTCSCADPHERFLKVKDAGKCLSTSEREQEVTIMALNNLIIAQKVVLDQQELHEQQTRKRHVLEEERERKRSQALEAEYLLLKEIRGNIRRKLNSISKPSDPTRNGDLKDCSEIYLHDNVDSGVFRVRSAWNFNKTFDVYCDMDTDGGGWTLIQRQGNPGFPEDYFQKNWNGYKNGFGDLSTDFWLGNEMILSLTNQGAYNIRFDFGDRRENDFAVYDSFWIEDENLKYRVHIDGYHNASGGAGDVFMHHNGSMFSTFDSNNALDPRCPQRGVDCTADCTAATYNTTRGWWYKKDCILDQKLKLHSATLRPQPNQEFVKTEIKIRPANFLKMKENI